MHVNEALADRLVERGVETVFGIPGKQSLPLNEAIDARDDVEFVVARHETAVSHEAWGYAETSGRMAATCVVPGPGDMNAMNGLKNARNDCTPLLHVAVETEPALRGGDAIHETPPDTYDNVVKENVLVETPESAVAELDRAIAVARTPPKGPVRVGVPKNFLERDVALADAGAYGTESTTGVPDDGVDSATAALADADAPAVVAGGGVRAADATDRLLAVAERLDAPVVTTYKGKGVVPEDHPLSAGVLCGGASPELRSLLADADAALGVGTDLDAVTTQGFSVDLPATLVTVTLHPSDVGQGYEPTASLVCDAGEALAALDDALDDEGRDRATDAGAERAAAVRRADAERLAPLRDVEDPPLTSASALQAVREALPREAVVSVDAGGFRIWTLVGFPAFGPRRYVNPGSWATMGTGLPGALGAATATPDADVVALTGDGGLLMCVHELHTAVAEGIPVTVVVLNNSDYAIISSEATRRYGFEESAFGWDETPVDCCALASSMGMQSVRAEAPGEIRDALGAALDSTAPTLVEVPTDPTEPQAGVWMRD